MEVFELRPLGQLLANKRMIQLLGVRVVEIRIPLGGRDLRDLVEVPEPRDPGERLHGRGERELVVVPDGQHARVRVARQDLRHEGPGHLPLGDALRDGAVDGGARVAVEGGRAALGREVDVDGEQRLALPLIITCLLLLPSLADELPGRDERLPRIRPRRVARVDEARVVLECRAAEDLVGRHRVAPRGVAAAALQLQDLGPVQVRVSDVRARRAAVRPVHGGYVGEVVHDGAVAQGRDGVGERREREVRVHGAVVGLAVVVLDLLYREQVRRPQVVHDVRRYGGHVGLVRRGEVLDVVSSDRDPRALPVA